MVGKILVSAGLALALGSAPVVATAAPMANPAASLSVSNARVGSTGKDSNKLSGSAGIFGLVILAGVVAIGVVAATDNGDDLPDSP